MRFDIEFLKGSLVAGMWGCLVSFVLALLHVVVTIFLFGSGWDGAGFARGIILMPFVIGSAVVPLSVILGLVYVIIRRALRAERAGSAAPKVPERPVDW